MDRQNFEDQVFNELPSAILCSNFLRCTFNASTHFERCNLIGCTFNVESTFDRCNVREEENEEDEERREEELN